MRANVLGLLLSHFAFGLSHSSLDYSIQLTEPAVPPKTLTIYMIVRISGPSRLKFDLLMSPRGYR